MIIENVLAVSRCRGAIHCCGHSHGCLRAHARGEESSREFDFLSPSFSVISTPNDASCNADCSFFDFKAPILFTVNSIINSISFPSWAWCSRPVGSVFLYRYSKEISDCAPWCCPCPHPEASSLRSSRTRSRLGGSTWWLVVYRVPFRNVPSGSVQEISFSILPIIC